MSPRPKKRKKPATPRGPAPPSARIPLPAQRAKRHPDRKNYDRREKKRRIAEELER